MLNVNKHHIAATIKDIFLYGDNERSLGSGKRKV